MKLFALFLVVIAVSCVTAKRTFPAHFHTTPVNHQGHIDHINSLQDSWTSFPSFRFMNSTLADVAGLCGALPNPEHLKQKMPVRAAPEVSAPLPDAFDARDNWPQCPILKLVRDQGACGSCWAVAAAKVFTTRRCIATNGADGTELSAIDLTSCCTSCGNGCDGGYPLAAMQYFTTTGIVSGGEYNSNQGCLPYPIASCDHHCVGHLQPCGASVSTPACVSKCEASYTVAYQSDKRVAKTAYQVSSSEQDIMKELMTYGPVEAAFSVFSDFPSYTSGVYKHVTGEMLGGHAVVIIGWGVENGNKYWLVDNNWNADWGLQGLFKIARGTDECGIESSIVAIQN